MRISSFITEAQRSVAYDIDRKAKFHEDGEAVLKRLATALGYKKGDFDLRHNQGGMAVSGEITLHSDTLYVQFSQSALGPDSGFMWRTCNGRKDYVGDANRSTRWEELGDLRSLAHRMLAAVETRFHQQPTEKQSQSEEQRESINSLTEAVYSPATDSGPIDAQLICDISAGPFSSRVYETRLKAGSKASNHEVVLRHLDQEISRATRAAYLKHFYRLDTHAMNASIELGDSHDLNIGWKEAYQYANVSDQTARLLDTLARGRTVDDWFREAWPQANYVQITIPGRSADASRVHSEQPKQYHRNYAQLTELLAGADERTLEIPGRPTLEVWRHEGVPLATLRQRSNEDRDTTRAPEVMFYINDEAKTAQPVSYCYDHKAGRHAYTTTPFIRGWGSSVPDSQWQLNTFVEGWFASLHRQGFFREPEANLACGKIRGSVWANRSKQGTEHFTLSIAIVPKAEDAAMEAMGPFAQEDLQDLIDLAQKGQQVIQELSLKREPEQPQEAQRVKLTP